MDLPKCTSCYRANVVMTGNACIYILHIAPYKSDQSIFVRHHYLLNHYWTPRSPRNFKFQINVGVSGATDVTTCLRLIKITNFLWPLPEATHFFFFFFFTIYISSQNFRVVTNVDGVGLRFICYDQFWRSI